MTDEPDERDLPDVVVSILAIVDGDTWLRSATVAHEAPGVVHVRTDEPVPLPLGSVVGLRLDRSPHDPVTVSLATVSETIGDTVTALRLIERRS